MKFAIIENEKVVNIVVAESVLESNWVLSETAIIGDTYINGVFKTTDPTQDAEAIAKQAETIREQRNSFLASSDWTQVADSPVDKEAWAVYRQKLRDITYQENFPFNVIWPDIPVN